MWREGKIKMDILVGLYLGICSVYDLKYRELPSYILYLAVAIFTLLAAVRAGKIGEFLIYIGLSSLPALFFAVLHVLKLGIGEADAFIIYSIGLAYGLRFTVFIIIMASMAVFLYGVGFVRTRDGYEKVELPFAPFLLLSTLIFFYLKI